MMVTTFWIRNEDPEALAVSRLQFITAIRTLLPETDVHEVGSTAVPGAIGKQDIDILVRVPANLFDSTRLILDASYERDLTQLSTFDYQGYKLSIDPDVAIQLTVAGGHFDCFMEFIQALRSDPALLWRYNELKRRWNGRSMEEYRKAKAEFIEEVLKQNRPGPQF